MKRDMDLIRELLFKLEQEPLDGNLYRLDLDGLGIEGWSHEDLAYHFLLLIDAGFVDGERGGTGDIVARKLTWKGHEFLDTVRSPEIWRRTKDGVAKVGTASIEFIWDLAKAYAKHLAKEKLGIDVT